MNAKDVIITPIRNRLLKHNQNFLCIFCGPTGSGKSYSALRFAEELDPNFNVNNVVFTAQEFMDLLNEPERLPSGSVVMWDEAGVHMGAREFSTLFNRLLMKILQTFRHRNICCIFTTPSFSFVDAQARRLLHGYAETVSIDRHTNEVITKFMFLQSSPRYADKVYFHYPLVSDETTKYSKITRIRFKKANKELLKAYEAKRELFTRKLNKQVQDQINRVDSKIQNETFNAEEVADRLMKDLPKITINGKVSLNLIMNQTGLGCKRAPIVRDLIKQRISDLKPNILSPRAVSNIKLL